MGETGRLRFLVDRDGPEAACAFARATLEAYRRVLLGRGPVRVLTLYRRPLIESVVVLRRFVAGCPGARGPGSPAIPLHAHDRLLPAERRPAERADDLVREGRRHLDDR